MHSLAELNTYGSFSAEFPDNRAARVIFDRLPPLTPIDQQISVAEVTVTINPGINIVEIINYSTTDAKFVIHVKTGEEDPLTGSTLTWSTIPAHMTLTQVDNTYTISGFKSPADWEIVKTFTWNLPADYESHPLWFLDAGIEYFDAQIEQQIRLDWEVFDIRFYYIAKLQSETSMSINALKAESLESIQSAAFNFVANVEGYLGIVPQTLQSNILILVDGNLNLLNMSGNFNLESTLNARYSGNAELPVISTVIARTIVNYELSQTFTNTVNNRNSAIALTGDATYAVTTPTNVYNFNGSTWDLQTVSGIGDMIAFPDDASHIFKLDDLSVDSNKISIFKRTGSTWASHQTITASTNANFNHIACSANGQYLAVTTVTPGLTNDPTLYIYFRATLSTTWSLQQTITVTEAQNALTNGNFVSISADGSTCAFTYQTSGGTSIRTRVYTRSGTTWSLNATLTYSSTSFFDDFKMSRNGTVIVAALSNNGDIITYSNSSGSWAQVGSVLSEACDALDINDAGDVLVVGRPTTGNCRFYYRYNGNFNWDLINTFTTGTSQFGSSIKCSSSGNTILVTDTSNSYIFNIVGS